MNETELEKLRKLQDNFEKWKRYNKKLESIPFKNPGHFIEGITLKFNVQSHVIEFYINDMDPIHKRIIFEKIAEAVKVKYEEIKKLYESVQIIIPNHE